MEAGKHQRHGSRRRPDQLEKVMALLVSAKTFTLQKLTRK